jgi:hypothetical protein
MIAQDFNPGNLKNSRKISPDFNLGIKDERHAKINSHAILEIENRFQGAAPLNSFRL